MFDSAPESIKKLFLGLMVENFCFLGVLKEVELSKFFLSMVML